MKVFYDWEFLDDGRSIEPISLGMVADDGREYYAVFKHITNTAVFGRITRHYWLMENVVRQLPVIPDVTFRLPSARYAGNFVLDYSNPAVKSRTTIRSEVRTFLEASHPVELWGYYSAYDHVALGQLFGPMVDRPAIMPMVTYDIVQLCHSLGRSESTLPADPQNVHNALEDARWTRDSYHALIGPPAAS